MSPVKSTLNLVANLRYRIKDALSRPLEIPCVNTGDQEVSRPCIRPLPMISTQQPEYIPGHDTRITELNTIESDHMDRAHYIALVLHTEKSYTGGKRTVPPPRRKVTVQNDPKRS